MEVRTKTTAMLITPIKINEEIRSLGRFYGKDGIAVPSVTTILSRTRDNSFLDRWNKNNPGKRDAAAKRGTAVHKCIEDFLQNKLENIPDEIEPFFASVLPFLQNIQPVFMELPIMSKEYGYAGRVDCGAIFGGIEGLPVIIDWKTSEKRKRSWYDYPLQLAAYLHGFKETYPDCPINFEHTLVVCATPGEAQIELFDPEQVEYYWQQFLVRCDNFHANNNYEVHYNVEFDFAIQATV